jgi:hypothetical protein
MSPPPPIPLPNPPLPKAPSPPPKAQLSNNTTTRISNTMHLRTMNLRVPSVVLTPNWSSGCSFGYANFFRIYYVSSA